MGNFKRFLPYYRYLKPVWWQFALGILFGVVYSVSSGLGLPIMAETVFPILFGDPSSAPEWLRVMVNRWFGEDVQGGFLILCCLFLPLMMVLRAAGSVGNGYFMTYVGVFVVQSIQIDVFKKVQSMPLAFFHRYKTGALVASIMGYPQQIKRVVVENSNDLIKQPLTLLSAVGFLVYKSFTSGSFFTAVIGVLSVPLIVFPIRAIGGYLAKKSKILVKMRETLNSSTIETIQSPLEIRAYNLEARQIDRFVGHLRGIFRTTMKSVRSRLIMSPSIEVVAASGLALSLYLGVRQGMEQGEFMALAVALYMAYTPIKKLGAIHGSLKTIEAPLDRLENILGADDTVPEAVNPTELPSPVCGAITFEGVDFKYAKGDVVLSGVSVEIKAGESVGLVGESGAGKSTFVNLIPRFFDPVQGRVLLDEVDVREFRLKDLRGQVAYVPQMPLLFNASVADNIRVGRPDATDEEVVAAARHAYAHEFIENLPNGYETELSERGNSLSGGQRQRVAIARAFLKDAPILVLDEATSALDNTSDQQIQEALRDLSQNRTTLIIAHRMGTLKHVKRRLFFKQGCLVGDGSHEELLNTSPDYVHLVNSETKASN